MVLLNFALLLTCRASLVAVVVDVVVVVATSDGMHADDLLDFVLLVTTIQPRSSEVGAPAPAPTPGPLESSSPTSICDIVDGDGCRQKDCVLWCC